MAVTPGAVNNHVKKFTADFFKEYWQENRFKSDMGTTENSIIQVNRDLSNTRGKTISFNLRNRMSGPGVTGTTTLVGSEEEITYRTFEMDVIKRRNAFVSHEQDVVYNSIDLLEAGKDALMQWAQDNTEERIIEAFNSINGVNYGSATEGQKDTWLTDNVDRVLFGDAVGNTVAGDHSASLAAVDATGVLSSSTLGIMKRLALTATPAIRPYRSKKSGRRYFCCYAHPWAFRDLKDDPVVQNAQRETIIQMQNEPIWKGGDLMWDGIVIKELDHAPILSGVGAAGIDVTPVFFSGAQALGYGISRDWYQTSLKEDDYGDLQGYAMNEIGNFAKLTFGSGASDTDDQKDHGLVTGYMAAVADA